MVEQLGLAMMLRLPEPLRAWGLTSGTTSGTSGSMRNCEVLSITTAPFRAALGEYSAEILAPGEENTRSMPRKSKVARFCTFTTSSSPKAISLPTERSEASAEMKSEERRGGKEGV